MLPALMAYRLDATSGSNVPDTATLLFSVIIASHVDCSREKQVNGDGIEGFPSVTLHTAILQVTVASGEVLPLSSGSKCKARKQPASSSKLSYILGVL
jgi:hypothetical protein